MSSEDCVESVAELYGRRSVHFLLLAGFREHEWLGIRTFASWSIIELSEHYFGEV